MKRSFYHYMMTLRSPYTQQPFAEFANHLFDDHSFPKQAEDYEEISSYLEMNSSYLSSMDEFDQAYAQYLEHNQ